jgi:hypothetical protein
VRPAGRIAALAFLKLHGFFSCGCDEQKPPRADARAPARSSARFMRR